MDFETFPPDGNIDPGTINFNFSRGFHGHQNRVFSFSQKGKIKQTEQIKEDFLRVNKIHNTATLLPPKGLNP